MNHFQPEHSSSIASVTNCESCFIRCIADWTEIVFFWWVWLAFTCATSSSSSISDTSAFQSSWCVDLTPGTDGRRDAGTRNLCSGTKTGSRVSGFNFQRSSSPVEEKSVKILQIRNERLDFIAPLMHRIAIPSLEMTEESGFLNPGDSGG